MFPYLRSLFLRRLRDDGEPFVQGRWRLRAQRHRCCCGHVVESLLLEALDERTGEWRLEESYDSEDLAGLGSFTAVTRFLDTPEGEEPHRLADT